MDFKNFLTEQLITEGGLAVKGTSPIGQSDARKLGPQLAAQVAKELNLPTSKVKMIGSAGNKPHDQMSGDIDIAVETDDIESVKAVAEKLAVQGKFKHMKGINVYSFAAQNGTQLVQVDLMPVEDIKYASWSFSAHEDDLKQGLKGAHRNELFFAIAKHAEPKVLKQTSDGKPLQVERLFYDLSKGLMRGVRSFEGKKGQAVKGAKMLSKEVITTKPDMVAKLLFGDSFKAADVATFAGALAAIKSPKFRYKAQREEILETAKKGIKKKELKDPMI
jgi:hypothetical protein